MLCLRARHGRLQGFRSLLAKRRRDAADVQPVCAPQPRGPVVELRRSQRKGRCRAVVDDLRRSQLRRRSVEIQSHTPGPAADAPDPYDRSGLFLIRAGDALRVVSVAPGSAAAKLGIAADDRVLAIDGAPVASKPLPAWRARFTISPVGTRIKLTVERAGKPRDAVLVLAELVP